MRFEQSVPAALLTLFDKYQSQISVGQTIAQYTKAAVAQLKMQ